MFQEEVKVKNKVNISTVGKSVDLLNSSGNRDLDKKIKMITEILQKKLKNNIKLEDK